MNHALRTTQVSKRGREIKDKVIANKNEEEKKSPASRLWLVLPRGGVEVPQGDGPSTSVQLEVPRGTSIDLGVLDHKRRFGTPRLRTIVNEHSTHHK